MNFSSKILENAVQEVALLPGIGKRTALRLVLHLLDQPSERTTNLASALVDLKMKIKFCKECHNISDQPICEICADAKRDQSLICIVEDVRDVMAIENTQQFSGVYHVLGGKINPMEGIGPSDLTIDSLIHKVNSSEITELIFALSSTMEGDTTNYYIFKQIEKSSIKVSTIARGIAVGDELEYADQISLGRSILQRVPFENSLKN
ncbi:recombination mediator RecR [Psychroflexus maritimus]|uniref:Recombination protein RecR n=1 Tax=Psychroflexus maritimus TaxID=2714865 RepID=A0A967DXI0_9FLAO|nr:recombination mediator RecR [Psychroflexus maritimus]NGZ88685.1 recombination protein RecR [Psychroflexus maritimus]